MSCHDELPRTVLPRAATSWWSYMYLVVLKSDYGTDREKEQKKPKKVKTRESEIHVRTRVVIGKCDGFVHEASPNGDLVAKPDVAR